MVTGTPELAPDALKNSAPRVVALPQNINELPATINGVKTADELNELARKILEQQSQERLTVTAEVKDAMQKKLDELKNEQNVEKPQEGTVDQRIALLEERLSYVREVLGTAKKPVEAPQAPSKTWYQKAFSYLGWRGVYTVMQFPEFLGLGSLPFANKFTDYGARQVAALDLKDALAQYSDLGLAFNGQFSDKEWNEFKTSGITMAELVYDYVNLLQGAPAVTPDVRTIRLAKLMKPEGIKEKLSAAATETLIASVLKANAEYGVTAVKLGTETSFKDGVLTIVQSESMQNGNARPGSNFDALITAKNVLVNVQNITITNEAMATLDWPKSAKISREYLPFLAELNEWMWQYSARRARKGIWYMGILNKSPTSDMAYKTRSAQKRKLKMLKGVDLSVEVNIIGNKVAIVSSSKDMVGLIIEDKPTADTLRNFHKALWAILPEYSLSK